MIKTDDVLLEADQLFRDSRYQEMIDLLNRSILEESTTPELYFFRGIAWMQLQRNDEAIDDLTKAIDLRPDFFRAWQNRGLAWSGKRKYDKAIRDLHHAIGLRPNHPSTYRQLGNALLQVKDYDQAVEVFNKAIELEPEAYDHYHNRGSAWRKKGEYQKAIADYNRAIALRPNHGRTFFGLGLIYEAIKEPELASIHYKRSYLLGFDKNQLAKIFSEQFPAPYLVKAIFAGNREGGGVETNFSALQWLTSVCKNWDELLDRLRRKGYPATHPEKYYSLEAIVHYYMGDPITAYHLFDTQFDADEHPYPLSLRDQYYLVLAAMDFKEPDNGLAYAIEQVRGGGQGGAGGGDKRGGAGQPGGGESMAGRPEDRPLADRESMDGQTTDRGPMDGQTSDREITDGQTTDREAMAGQPIESYYAGQLLLLHNDLREALQRFDECGDFLPALYGKMTAYQWLGDEEMQLQVAREIAALDGESFLDGIEPLIIPEDMSIEEMAGKIFSMLPYYELRDEIERTRALLGRIPARAHLEFHELVSING
ncbi:MAG TPA: tetratricopeptide repeat protein [Puia sp.]|nr:tetratricopeptide repeat protein [Puia sp.]